MDDTAEGGQDKIAAAAANLPREHFVAGAVIFADGDAGDSAYVIERGCVEILDRSNGKERRIAVLGDGALFGEVALIDCLPRTATARALVPTALIRIGHDHVAEILRRSDPVLQYLLHIVLIRFREARGAETHPAADTGGQTTEDPSGSAYKAALRMLALTEDLAHGVAAGQLELHYQPICCLDDNTVAGFEALVRWRHPTLGLISPLEFIGLAEKTGLIHGIGNWVVERALADWAHLRLFCAATVDAKPFISVNLSAPECVEQGIVGRIDGMLQAAGVAPEELRIELTESVLVDHIDALSQALHSLRNLGVTIAMDDFGTGYSGLDYLRALPFSSIKIDQAFVRGMDTSVRSMEIVKAALSLAEGIGLKTVAEGIEDRATGLHLADMGCTFAQGYHYGRPMPLHNVAAWFDDYRRRLPDSSNPTS
jgi:EAL domain-containing protein (putative c-di-GMP-specific phosphodiesterase class I)